MLVVDYPTKSSTLIGNILNPPTPDLYHVHEGARSFLAGIVGNLAEYCSHFRRNSNVMRSHFSTTIVYSNEEGRSTKASKQYLSCPSHDSIPPSIINLPSHSQQRSLSTSTSFRFTTISSLYHYSKIVSPFPLFQYVGLESLSKLRTT